MKEINFNKTYLMKRYYFLINSIKNILNFKDFSFIEKKWQISILIEKYILLLKRNLIRFKRYKRDFYDYNSLNKTASYIISFIDIYNEKLFFQLISDTFSFYFSKLYYFYTTIFSKSRKFI